MQAGALTSPGQGVPLFTEAKKKRRDSGEGEAGAGA